MWVETLADLRMKQFEGLLKVVRERGGDGPRIGRPWCLPLQDRVLVVAVHTGLVVPHCKRPGRPLLAGEEADNAEHRRVRARVEHAIGRLKNYKILRDCRQHGDGLHHAVQAVAHMHNLAGAT